MVRHNRRHKMQQSIPLRHAPLNCYCLSLRISVRGHVVISITEYHESHHVGVLDNPLWSSSNMSDQVLSKQQRRCPYETFL